MAYENSVGQFLNESAPPLLPGQLDNFDDAAAPEGNELLDSGVDYRNQYYQEDATVLSKLGLAQHSTTGADGQKQDADAGIFTGTVIGDGFEAWDKIRSGLAGEAGAGDLYAGVLKAQGVVSTASTLFEIGSDIAKGIPLAKFDPFNFLGSAVMGWMLEHVEPMRKSLDSLAGNPDMVKAYSSSWDNISKSLSQIAENWNSEVGSGTAAWSGAAASAYRARADELIAAVATEAALAEVLSTVNKRMGEIVETVRGLISEILSSLAGMLVEITAILIASAGTASPALIARAVAEISVATMSTSRILAKLVTALIDLKSLVRSSISIITAVTGIESATANV